MMKLLFWFIIGPIVSSSYIDSLPVGSIIAWTSDEKIPEMFAECDGSLVNPHNIIPRAILGYLIKIWGSPGQLLR